MGTNKMPYGIPKDAGGDSPDNVEKMHRCVESVMQTGKSKESAIRICKSSMFGMNSPEISAENLLETVNELQAVGRMISRKNLQTLRDAHRILGDLIVSADQMESARVVFEGESLKFNQDKE